MQQCRRRLCCCRLRASTDAQQVNRLLPHEDSLTPRAWSYQPETRSTASDQQQDKPRSYDPQRDDSRSKLDHLQKELSVCESQLAELAGRAVKVYAQRKEVAPGDSSLQADYLDLKRRFQALVHDALRLSRKSGHTREIREALDVFRKANAGLLGVASGLRVHQSTDASLEVEVATLDPGPPNAASYGGAGNLEDCEATERGRGSSFSVTGTRERDKAVSLEFQLQACKSEHSRIKDLVNLLQQSSDADSDVAASLRDACLELADRLSKLASDALEDACRRNVPGSMETFENVNRLIEQVAELTNGAAFDDC